MTRMYEELTSTRYAAARRMSYVALDVPSWEAALNLIDRLGDAVDGYKLGLELFHSEGPRAVEALCKLGKRVFLDVKLHDIPNTVAGALRAACQFPIEMVNVHALGGRTMLEGARAAVDEAPYQPLLIAVTVLTSLNQGVFGELGFAEPVPATVERLVDLTVTSGLDGVVASALETEAIRRQTTPGFEIVVPGTRPAGSGHHDQARSLTPGEAVLRGASRLVLGRAVTQSPEPLVALQGIWDEMTSALSELAQRDS